MGKTQRSVICRDRSASFVSTDGRRVRCDACKLSNSSSRTTQASAASLASSQSVVADEPTSSSQPAVSDSNDDDNSIAAVEAAIPAHSCSLCDKSFRTKRGLSSHVGRSHPAEANAATAARISRDSRSRPQQAVVPSETLPKAAVINGLCNSKPPNADIVALRAENAEYTRKFELLLLESSDTSRFDSLITEYSKFLFTANSKLPGPVHPAVKFFRARKKKRVNRDETTYAASSNPARTNAKTRQRRRDQYKYDLAQYYYYNQRKKVCRLILNAKKSRRCTIPLDTLSEKFRSLFESENCFILDQYSEQTDRPEDYKINMEDIQTAFKGISMDTAAGLDRILVRTIKTIDCLGTIKVIADFMLRSHFIPTTFRTGRIVLIDKGEDDADSTSNWRPITIYSVLRRIIERALDRILRKHAEVSCHQRGFISSPGTHVNASLVNACLKHAKQQASDCVVVFIDISKAFDNIGHAHLRHSLTALNIPSNVRELIMALVCNNEVKIESDKKFSEAIKIRRGVAQGLPLSPLLFNIAIDFILREISEPAFANNFGYQLYEDLCSISIMAFADDVTLVAKNLSAALRLVELCTDLFAKIGLNVNARKCAAINIASGKQESGVIRLLDGTTINCIEPNASIKYLGVSFADEIIFDKSIAVEFESNLELLRASPLLKPDQKLNIINQYIFPQLTYPLQAAPLVRTDKGLLRGLDVIIRRTIKSVCGLPAATCSDMIYAPRKFRGLAAVCCEWEAPLQHFSIADKLSRVRDEHFSRVRDFEAEQQQCKAVLGVEGTTSTALRAALRLSSFGAWCSKKWQGVGIGLCREFPAANSWVFDKNLISSSEWTAGMKLNTNYAPLRGVPGVVSVTESNLCRVCGKEKETPAHVLGNCGNNSLQITERHHRVKRKIRRLLEEKKYKCFEEVYAKDDESRVRYNDIVAIDTARKKGFIIDPTIRFEHSIDQAIEVDREKKAIYEPCVPYLADKYRPVYGELEWEVIGLFFGSRGMIPKFVVDFWMRFDLPINSLTELSQEILSYSISIINSHINSAPLLAGR